VSRIRNVLLVDDDADLRLALELALEAAGYSVAAAASAEEALAVQRRRPAEVLVTDIFMPDGDGFEVIERFQREFPDTRIVVVSGGGKRTKRDYLAVAQLMKVDATLQKPFEVEALLETLRSL
jgi:DNA-binding NtrC family response regulator